jgi:hypothetical protein
MPEYRGYIIGSDGHIQKAVEECERGNAAMEPAWQPVDVHGFELWQRTRKTARFHHDPDSSFECGTDWGLWHFQTIVRIDWFLTHECR